MVKCKLCSFEGKRLEQHLKWKHEMNLLEYQKQTGATTEECFDSDYRKNLSDKMIGENNPGYQHGGKYSPWSKKSKFYSEESKTKAANNRVNSTSLEYWMIKTNGDEKEAKRLQSEYQKRFSLEICVEKYGKKLGNEIWTARQIAWREKMNSKTPEEIADINKRKVTNGFSISKAEVEIAESLDDVETQLILIDGKKHFLYDFAKGKKIVEYNGDFWHMNPECYKENDRNPTTKQTAKTRWELDRKKNEFAESQGYEVLVIWEKEYMECKEKAIQKIKQFLT